MPPASVSSEIQHQIKKTLIKETTTTVQTQVPSFAPQYSHNTRSLHRYQHVIEGGVSHTCKVAIPPLPKINGRTVHEVWPTTSTIAANEKASATGDPHIKGGDGGRFDFQGRPGRVYNLLNDSGLQLNAKFRAWLGAGTAISEVGLTVTGRGGYSRVTMQTKVGRQLEIKINGRRLLPGQSTRLADGGTLHLSKTGKSVSIRTREGYRTRVHVKGNGLRAHLDVHISSPRQGVARDGRMPGGLLGHTFDKGKDARHGAKGRGAQGEGAIDGHYTDYEVLGGLHARPKAKITKAKLAPTTRPIGPVHRHYLGDTQKTEFNEFNRTELQETWRQITQQMTESTLIQNTLKRKQNIQRQTRKTERLLMAALNSGNMDLAVIMLASIETQLANDVTSGLVKQIHTLQKQRQSLSSQMAKLGNKGKDASKLSSLSTQAQNIGTEISLLQTFLQDSMSSKRNTQEFASNWIRQSHETTRSIIQNIGR